jgi:hypothetical protein
VNRFLFSDCAPLYELIHNRSGPHTVNSSRSTVKKSVYREPFSVFRLWPDSTNSAKFFQKNSRGWTRTNDRVVNPASGGTLLTELNRKKLLLSDEFGNWLCLEKEPLWIDLFTSIPNMT